MRAVESLLYKLSLFLVLGVSVFAAETKVTMKDLPAAVQKTVAEQTRAATLRGLSKEIENGKTYYEAESTVNGKSRDVLIDPNGTIVEVEESVTLESMPDAARIGLKREAGSGRILRVESVTRESVVSYEAVVERHGKKSEVSVNADGSRSKH